MKIKMDAKIIFHPFPIPEQTMQQNNTFREFHLSYIEKEGVIGCPQQVRSKDQKS